MRQELINSIAFLFYMLENVILIVPPENDLNEMLIEREEMLLLRR